MFKYEEKNKNIKFKILENEKILKDNFSVLFNFVKNKGLDLNKIYKLTALIYLNMSPLHHSPFDKILFLLSKKILSNKNFFQKYEPN